MRKIIRLLSIICAVFFVFSPLPVFAHQPDYSFVSPQESPQNVITEYIDENQSIVRTYNRSETNRIALADIEEPTRQELTELLIELGYDEDAIPLITEEEWAMYASSPSIMSVTTYQKSDQLGNVTIVSEEEALSAAESAHISPADTDVRYSEYIKLVLLVIETTNEPGGYYFTASARWLTLPLLRTYCSIGIVAKPFSYTPSSRTGQYYYCSTTTNHITGEVTYLTRDDTLTYLDSSNITSVNTDGGWSGYGFAYPLYPDTANDVYTEVCTDLYVQIKYSGFVVNPAAETYFNVHASHVRSRVVIVVTPSITADPSGSTPSIGIGFDDDYQITPAELQIHYTP